MELRRMMIADQASQAAETIAALAAAAAQATSSQSSRDPGPMFSTGQSVLHWWCSWASTAVDPPKETKGKQRPQWFDATIYARFGKKDVHYAGFEWKDVYCYGCVG